MESNSNEIGHKEAPQGTARHTHLIHAILVGFPQPPVISVLALELRRPAEPTLVSEAHDCVSSCQHL